MRKADHVPVHLAFAVGNALPAEADDIENLLLVKFFSVFENAAQFAEQAFCHIQCVVAVSLEDQPVIPLDDFDACRFLDEIEVDVQIAEKLCAVNLAAELNLPFQIRSPVLFRFVGGLPKSHLLLLYFLFA